MITNNQLYFAIGIPFITVLASMTISLIQISAIRDDIKSLREDIREIRADIKLLTGKVYELMAKP